MKRSVRVVPEAAGLAMTPMIDLVFLLLVFFLMSVKPVDVMAHLDAMRPAGDVRGGASVLRLDIRAEGFELNRHPLDSAQLRTMLQKLGQLDANQAVVLINAPDAPHGRMIEALNDCSAAGLTRLSVVSGR